ncbi:hypothetical protein KY084_14975 [Stakelama sp. CBK3Z-3]|uniref:Metalloprotease PmbA n=1 Tax=Stakelama flava TaxID=2860338 RepID=A0ABS6XPM1_9SPHN|nr:metallopeptidase TldD-related protein [Stakelama flava]MBW4332163.1 hypothetical protein [Stakelama flava]
MQGTEKGYLLNSRGDLSQIARNAANRALALGAQEVVASATEMAGIVMRARRGVFENAVREGAQFVTIRVFHRGRMGTATTAALDPDAIDLTAGRAIAIAQTVESDPDAAPADDEWLARSAPEIEMFVPSGLSAQDLGRIALEIEAGCIAEGEDAVRVGEAGAASVDACSAIAIGRDFDRSLIGSRHDLWCTALGERDGMMAQDSWSSTDRRLSQLQSAALVGATAADRARRKLGGRALTTRTCPVLFDATVAASLVHEIVRALGGHAQVRGATFLGGGIDSQALADHIDLLEDPFEPFGLASGACDGEGVVSLRRRVIAGGRVQGYFLSCLYARKLGLVPTGNADGPRNLHFTSRDRAEPLDAMLRRMGRGLWLTELIGGAVDPVSGAYSKAAAGFWIEDGEVAFPVQDITIAGDLPVMLRQIVAIGSDVHRNGAVRTGSVLIERMRVSGR